MTLCENESLFRNKVLKQCLCAGAAEMEKAGRRALPKPCAAMAAY